MDATKTVFLTGSTGYCGSRVFKGLLERGYKVRGLSRTQEGADRLRKEHAKFADNFEIVVGTLTDYDLLEREARRSDGVIHCGFIHDFTKFEESIRIDREIIAIYRKALQGSGKTLITCSGTGVIGDTGHTPVDDAGAAEELLARVDGGIPPSSPLHARQGCEIDTLLANREAGFKASSMRLPAYVYGDGGSWFVPAYIAAAKKLGKALYLEEGEKDILYSAVHVDDVAEQFIAAFERTPGGSIYHSSGEFFSMKQFAEAASINLGVPMVAIHNKEEAVEAWGPLMTHFYTTDNITSNSLAEKELGWKPKSNVRIFEDIARGSYKQKQ